MRDNKVNILKLIVIGTLSMLVVGCNDTITRLWNSGPYISKNESKAYSYCRIERRKNLPRLYNAMEKNELMSVEEIRQYNSYLEECMKRQGY